MGANSIIFYDDFTDANANGWEEHLGYGGSWKVENGEYIGSVSYNSWGSATYSLTGNVNWDNYILELKFKNISGIDKVVKFRYNSQYEHYAFNLRSGYNDLVVGKGSPRGGGWIKSVSVENFTGVWYKIKVVLNGTKIQIYIDDQLKFDFDDTDRPILNGKIGLEVWPGAAAAVTTVAFDDVMVTSLDSASNLLPVPYFSQRDPAWGQDEYDHATKWVDMGEEPTMEWWGCALTSGAMTARYFGLGKTPYNEELTPKTLNNWMKDQNDANFRNGAMNWQLLSRMSAKTADLFGTNKLDLSLSKVANNFPKLDAILTQESNSFPGLPGILEVTHPVSPNGKHFVVAKGQSGATFGINDPYDQNKNLLSAIPYNNSFDKMVWYEPTHSNLSTIFLVVENDIDIRVLHQNTFIGEQFDLNPLGADGGIGGESGEILRMFYLEKPTSGYYSIGLSTDSPQPESYRLDIYLYDRNAEVKMATFIGWVGPGDFDDVYVDFDLEDARNSRVYRPIVTFNTLREDINLSHLLGWIDNKGITTSLLAKVDAAENTSQKSNKNGEENILNALLTQLGAQEGKQVDYSAYELLEADIETLLSQL